MPGMVFPSNVPEPLWPKSTDDVKVVAGRLVYFTNFTPGSAVPKQAHRDFIRAFLVPYYIAQLNASEFSDARLRIPLHGFASATGNSATNAVLSYERGHAIGNVIEAEFRKQAKAGRAASITQFQYDIRANGDVAAKEKLKHKGSFHPQDIENAQGGFRSVATVLRVGHEVEESDSLVRVREIVDPKFKVKKVPANELEMKLEELKKKIPAVFSTLSFAIDNAISVLKSELKTMLSEAEFAAPEILLLFKGIEFLVPTEAATQFEFINSRGMTRKYVFSGDSHSVDLGMLEVICNVLSFSKWCLQLPPKLQVLEDERKAEAALKGFEKKIREAFAKKLGIDPKHADKIPIEEIEEWARDNRIPLSAQQINKLAKMIPLNQSEEFIQKALDAIKQFKKLAGFAKGAFDFITQRGGLARQMFGDQLIDKLSDSLKDPTRLLSDGKFTTSWFDCQIQDVKVPDISTLGGLADLEVRSLIFGKSTVRLDFAPRQNQPLLGFQGHAMIEREWQVSTTVAKFEIVRGPLTLTSAR